MLVCAVTRNDDCRPFGFLEEEVRLQGGEVCGCIGDGCCIGDCEEDEEVVVEDGSREERRVLRLDSPGAIFAEYYVLFWGVWIWVRIVAVGG
jgi:hypothetical protein